jgi:hypothetical protein
MQIRLKKGRDGPDSLACVREDGTSTWRRIQRGLAFHDLSHYAVETELGLSEGFYGLVASGWTFERFAAEEERSKIPPEATWVELVVNEFMTEAMCGALLDADAFHESLSKSGTKLGIAIPRRLGDEEVARIRGTIVALVARWKALAPSGTLELPFPAARAAQPPSLDSIRRSGTSHQSATNT